MNTNWDVSFGRKRITVDTEREGHANDKSNLAARAVMILGAAALLLFFVFASFGKNAEPIEYTGTESFDSDGAVSVFSRLISSDGITADNSEVIKKNDRNIYSEASDVRDTKWNLWQYLCDSLAELFGVDYQ